FLHTQFCAPHVEDGRLVGVLVENKSGRGAIRARYFIDATGDADLCARLPGLECYYADHLQPATACARIEGWKRLNSLPTDSGIHSRAEGDPPFDLGALIREHREEFDLVEGFNWGCYVPNSELFMLAATRIYNINPANADELTAAEIEGRRQVRAILDLLRKYRPDAPLTLQALPGRLGLRESRHVRCQYQLTGDDVLHGRPFADAIACGSYRVDIHHQDKPGITLRYLDGREEYAAPGRPKETRRWRGDSAENPTFYQIPLQAMLPRGPYENLIVAGRMIDADAIAHAAIRVMVNLNQTGEAAGVACAIASQTNASLPSLNPNRLRQTLNAGGSMLAV
ncbi:MAG TPA: FAD-dependent oxidoreductase, partial [Candidatus Synoicihabitans sp.]|nr:FAD-dependent oxidoreductase [Candidatus Synoicihabitans sp.]